MAKCRTFLLNFLIFCARLIFTFCVIHFFPFVSRIHNSPVIKVTVKKWQREWNSIFFRDKHSHLMRNFFSDSNLCKLNDRTHSRQKRKKRTFTEQTRLECITNAVKINWMDEFIHLNFNYEENERRSKICHTKWTANVYFNCFVLFQTEIKHLLNMIAIKITVDEV